MFLYLMNLFYVALKKRSVTIALVFALTLQGISVGGHMREMFRALGLIWPLVWILPIMVVWLLARHEQQWLPHEKFRRRLALFLVAGSIVFGLAMARFENPPKSRPPSSAAAAKPKPDPFSRLGTKGR